MEDFIPPHIPDGQNVAATPIFKECFSLKENSRLRKLQLPWNGVGKTPPGDNRLVQIAKKLDTSFSGGEAEAGRVVLESLCPSSPALAEVREALRRPKVEWPLDYSKGIAMPFEHLSPCMSASKLLRERSLAELAVGSLDKAFEDTMSLLAISQVVAPPRFLICELVQSSILLQAMDPIVDGLRRGAWTDSDLATLSNSLALQHLARHMADALRVDRAFAQQTNWGDLKTLTQISDSKEPFAWSKTFQNIAWQLRPSGWLSRDRATHLRLMQQMIEALNDANGSSFNVSTIKEILAMPSKSGIFTSPMAFIAIPAVSGALQKTCFVQTLLECTRTACALERYRQANTRLPGSLSELVPTFLPSVPNDPITGKALFYKPAQDGSFVVYGVGRNQTDDGGSNLALSKKWSLGEADWGISITKAP